MKIYELLGLEPLEKFRIKNNDNPESIFCFNSDDELCYYIETYHINWGRKPTITLHPCEDKSKLFDLIHTPELISKIEDEKEAPKEIILSLHDSIILSGVETQYNTAVKSVKKNKNWPGFMVWFKNNENWKNYFDFYFLELDFLDDNIEHYDMIEFEIGKNEKGRYVAKQVLE